MSDLRDEFAWAAWCKDGSPRPFIHPGTVRYTRREAMEAIGEPWAKGGETALDGWKRARRNGWRTIRVRVSAALSPTETNNE